MSTPAPTSKPVTGLTTTKATTTTQRQPQPQLQPQHRSRPSRDDELTGESFKDSDRPSPKCCCSFIWSPYWYVAIRVMSCGGFGLILGFQVYFIVPTLLLLCWSELHLLSALQLHMTMIDWSFPPTIVI